MAKRSALPTADAPASASRTLIERAYEQLRDDIVDGRLAPDEKLRVEHLKARYGVSAPQLCIRYLLQLGAVVLPKATTPAHIQQNAELDFEIGSADMAIELSRNLGTNSEPSGSKPKSSFSNKSTIGK